MSDAKTPEEDHVHDSGSVDDVVGQANAGLADAEAAGREAVGEPAEPAVVHEEPVPDATAVYPAAPAERTDDDLLADADSWTAPEPRDPAVHAEPSATAESAYAVHDAPDTVVADSVVAEPVVAEPVVTASEPVDEPTVVAPSLVAPAAQPIFVQAPEPPRPRGNRGAAGAIGLLAALAFALLYLGAYVVAGLVTGDRSADSLVTDVVAALTTAAFWVPVAVFFIGFWLLGAIINRGGWAHWVVFGLLVGFVAYVGHILGQLVQAPFWELSPSQGLELVQGELFAPLAIAAFIFGRELTIWFGAWVARRGKRVHELNVEAQREYERTLEAGPTLVRG